MQSINDVTENIDIGSIYTDQDINKDADIRIATGFDSFIKEFANLGIKIRFSEANHPIDRPINDPSIDSSRKYLMTKLAIVLARGLRYISLCRK